MTERQKLRAIIIGAGKAAGGHPDLSHAAAYTASNHSSLVGLVDPDVTQANSFFTQWGKVQYFSSLSKLKASGRKVDIISVCSPTGSHADALKELLTWDIKAIWCEKPITPLLEESSSIVTSFDKRGILFAVNHSRRWIARLRELGNQIAVGNWGKLYGGTAFYNKGILNNGSHLIDLIQLLVGPVVAERVTRVHGTSQQGDMTLDAILLDREKNPIQIIAPYPTNIAHFELKLFFEYGELSIERSGQILRTRQLNVDPLTGGLKTLNHGKWEHLNIANVSHAALTNIENAIINSCDLYCDGRTALASQKVCQELLSMALSP